MKLPHAFLHVIVALVTTTVGWAQTAARPSSAHTAWQALTALRTPVVPAAPTPPVTPAIPGTLATPPGNAVSVAKITPAQLQASDKAAADRARQVSSAAKDFYTQFPTHTNAAEARKVEATAALSGLKSATPAQEQAALRVAGDFRQNKGNPAEDRFDVALAMDRFQSIKTLGGKPLSKNPQAYERLADDLRAEFGDRPEGFRLYAGIGEAISNIWACWRKRMAGGARSGLGG